MTAFTERLIDRLAGKLAYLLHKPVVAYDPLWQALFDQAWDAIILQEWSHQGLPGAVIAANSAACGLLGCTPAEILAQTSGSCWLPLSGIAPETLCELASSSRATFLAGQTTRDGAQIPMEASSSLLAYGGRQIVLSHLRDAGRYQDAQPRPLEALTMEALGRLVQGTAHALNNLTLSMHSYASLALSALLPNEPAAADLHRVVETAHRASRLTRQLSALSAQHGSIPEHLCLNDLVADMDGLLRSLVREDAAIGTRLDPSLGTVEADVGQIGLALVTMTDAVCRSMPTGGAITIATANAAVAQIPPPAGLGSGTGSYAVLTVSGAPASPDEETVPHLPDLRVADAIARSHGGRICATGQFGGGITLNLYLPRVSRTVGAVSAQPAETPLLPRGKESVLVVEDEGTVRAALVRMLTAQGYPAFSAADGDEALMLAGGCSVPIHLLITDAVMPHMGGEELSRSLRVRLPDLPVLYISGYIDGPNAHHDVPETNDFALTKPFSSTELARKVRSILDRQAEWRRRGVAAGNATDE
ncbi:MAG: response regulator [Anaerolineae bacterium]